MFRPKYFNIALWLYFTAVVVTLLTAVRVAVLGVAGVPSWILFTNLAAAIAGCSLMLERMSLRGRWSIPTRCLVSMGCYGLIILAGAVGCVTAWIIN